MSIALLWQAANVFQVKAASTSSSTSFSQLILSECSVEVNSCSAESGCSPCLTSLQSTDLPVGSETSGADCDSSYTEFCGVLRSVGCDMENAFVDDLAACATGVTFAACDSFETCSAYLSDVLTAAPTSSPTSTPQTPTPSTMSAMTPSPSSAEETSGASTRLQGVWSTAIICFSLAYVARAAYGA